MENCNYVICVIMFLCSHCFPQHIVLVFSERESKNTEKVIAFPILTVGSQLPSSVVLPLLGRPWHRSLLPVFGVYKHM